jgi:hypothetical protein
MYTLPIPIGITSQHGKPQDLAGIMVAVRSERSVLMKKPLVLCMIALASASLACSLVTGSGGNTGTQTKVLFQDNFSNTSSGWDKVDGSDVTTDYANGQYNILVNKTQYDAWANPGQSFAGDVVVEVDATKNAGPDQNDFGVICRYTDVNNFYYFQITSDGQAVIGKVSNGTQSKISGSDYQSSSVINQGQATNHIRGDCVGDTLTLYVNGQQIMSATDSDHTSGDAGLMAGTFDTPGADILFDNFVVREP